MPKRTKAGRRKSRAQASDDPRSAISLGRAQAADIIEFRNVQRQRRATVARRLARQPAADFAPRIPEQVLSDLGPRVSAGVLVAEGDSWFDYPLNDVLRLLEDAHGYDVESVAHKGDRVEDMAYAEGQYEEFARRLEKLLRERKVPRAILLSGGGNDLAGPELALLLNAAGSGLPSLNEDIVRGVIDVRLRDAFVAIIAALTAISQRYLNRPIPVVTHGYDYPVPDGRGFLGGWWALPGPWLEPGFRQKGYRDRDRNLGIMKVLIDRFNRMLAAVSAVPEFSHVHYLDLRGTLATDATYKRFWANELHPTGRGFDLVTSQFAALLASL
jgi:lysophospholipase L1-like esterase